MDEMYINDNKVPESGIPNEDSLNVKIRHNSSFQRVNYKVILGLFNVTYNGKDVYHPVTQKKNLGNI